MNLTRNVIRLFVASPADTSSERSSVERVVDEINRTIASKVGLFVELVRWEDMVPGMGSRPEQVILDQAEIEHSDIFVGILWNRFGTPTGRADSGTEEEFRVAYDAWQHNAKPHIMFYFRQTPANLLTDQEIEQKSRVLKFRQQVLRLGIVREFDDSGAFESLLRQDLVNYIFGVRSLLGQPIDATTPAPHRTRKPELNRMVLVPAGAFLAGSMPSEAVIKYDFYIDVFPVTNSDFLAFLEETSGVSGHVDPLSTENITRLRVNARERPDHPVTGVSWFEALEYAHWLGKRLPTALEWEKSARGSDGRAYPWGNEFVPSRCNSVLSGQGDTTPVYLYEGGRSPYGCYDMVGNVFEWVDDWTETPRLSSTPRSEKINRGGSYHRSADELTCWYTESDPPALRMLDVGFRCVTVPEPRDIRLDGRQLFRRSEVRSWLPMMVMDMRLTDHFASDESEWLVSESQEWSMRTPESADVAIDKTRNQKARRKTKQKKHKGSKRAGRRR